MTGRRRPTTVSAAPTSVARSRTTRERRLDGTGHGPVPRLDDRRLLASDLGNRGAEQILVVERDVGHHGDAEVEHVGAVEPAAEPDLADQHLGAGPSRREDARRP